VSLGACPNAKWHLHSPLFTQAAKYGCSAPSFAPAGAREGGGREGGREEASQSNPPPSPPQTANA